MRPVHPQRTLRHKVKAKVATGTPRRWALGVVQSVTTGTAQLTIDGGTTNLPAFIPMYYTGTAWAPMPFPANAVVGVELVGAKAYIVARYS